MFSTNLFFLAFLPESRVCMLKILFVKFCFYIESVVTDLKMKEKEENGKYILDGSGRKISFADFFIYFLLLHCNINISELKISRYLFYAFSFFQKIIEFIMLFLSIFSSIFVYVYSLF